MQEQWDHKIFTTSGQDFESHALATFRFQYHYNTIYKNYTDALRIDIDTVHHIEQIPFLPIRFFKSHVVKTGFFEPAAVFESSGTTGTINSRHYVKDTSLYKKSFLKSFEAVYGSVKDWCIIGLLPSYLERNNSSLVYMVNELVQQSKHSRSGFYLNEYDRLSDVLKELGAQSQKTLLIGVTFALLDFAEKHSLPLHHTIIVETGGMKGRRQEMIRQEVHEVLKKSFSLSVIHSEYGMTELLSQAWSVGDGFFNCPSWMKILVRDEEDPLSVKGVEEFVGTREEEFEEVNVSRVEGVRRRRGVRHQGAINIIDLANIHSCCFIATDDIGRIYRDGSFEVLGRMDNSDLRGCSLMVV